jgi:hypothetical protein
MILRCLMCAGEGKLLVRACATIMMMMMMPLNCSCRNKKLPMSAERDKFEDASRYQQIPCHAYD